MLQKLQEMLEIQDKLNIQNLGESWYEGVTKNGKNIHWKRSMYMELANIIELFPWNHADEYTNALNKEKIYDRLVVVWSYLMGELLTNYHVDEVLEIVEENMDYEAEKQIPDTWKKQDYEMIDIYLEPFEVCMGMSLLPVQNDEFIESFVQAFFVALDAVGITFAELFTAYMNQYGIEK